MRFGLRWSIAGALACSTLCGAPFAEPPADYTLVAEDDCGSLDGASRVVRGTAYLFSSSLVSGPLKYRDIVYDDAFCLLRYQGLNPAAAYKVDVVYVTEQAGGRSQTLEANGLPVHDVLQLPDRTPGRFIFDLPRAAYAAGGPLELKFIRATGANAVVCYVSIWSTDPRPLPGEARLWRPDGPIEEDWARQDRLRGKPRFNEWKDPEAEVRGTVAPCVAEVLKRGAEMIGDFTALGANEMGEAAAGLDELARRRDELLVRAEYRPRVWLKLYLAARWQVRRLAFRNPLLDSDGLLFVRRHHPHARHQCSRRLGTFSLPGGAICVLRGMGPEGEGRVEELTAGRFPEGVFGRPDLSFDGQRLLFGFAPARGKDEKQPLYGPISQVTAPLYATHQTGKCHPFQVWEMGIEGMDPAPRRLTAGPYENSDPLHLPDGRIAFMSHRPGGLVQCGDWALAYCVFAMNSDGGDPRQITVSKDGEWDPFLLDDGTIGFTRWEYVMKFWSPIQMLWSVRPDGTNPRMIYGSDLSRDYAYPLNYASARQVPGTSKLVCIGSAHHNTGAGPVCLIDLRIGRNAAEGMQRITPVRFVETPDKLPHAGWYDCPYPLSDPDTGLGGGTYFLVSYSFSPDEADTTGYGIYLLDVYGGKELIYRDPELSALFPMPLRARPRPTVLPEATEERLGESGEFFIQDVHVGLAAEQRGKGRYVRVVECHERRIHTKPYAIQVGPDSGFETKTVLGTVPVAADGSAAFRVPAGKSVFFSVLDKDYRALHTMRSVTNVQAGERVGCVGCHEPAERAPAAGRRALAPLQGPAALDAPPWGVRPMAFEELLQPLLDRRCIRCHDGSGAEGKAFDLTDRSRRSFMGVDIPVSYFNLRESVRHAPIHTYFLPPGTFGSRVSKLTEVLLKGHNEVKLTQAEWRLFCAWIDCNAPAIGDYEVAAVGKSDARVRERLVAARAGGSADRRAMLAGRLQDGETLVCYLDCGPRTSAGEEGGVRIREVAGTPYSYGATGIVEPWFDDITFDAREIVYEVSGLDPGREYRLGFSWWDHNNAAREQAVVLRTFRDRDQEIVPATRLPAWRIKQEKPEERVAPLPVRATAEGTIQIAFVNRNPKSNAVVSEVWIVAAGKSP